jgi:hypothetical protein
MPAAAGGFSRGELDGLYNVLVSYGAIYRLHEADPDLYAIASGGTAPSANADNGTLNYDEGAVSNLLRVNGEMALSWRSIGYYGRGTAFYDSKDSTRRTDLTSDAENDVGSNAELRESYLNFRLTPGGMPVVLRVGKQVLNWSETSFVRDGLDIINPADLVATWQPASSLDDLRIPQGMIWGAANVTEAISVEAFYQYDWQRVRLPPVGWYFSTNDAAGGAGLGSWMFGNGRTSDLGTDLDQAFDLPEGTLGFDPNYQRLTGLNRETPDATGQYGISLVTLLPNRNATKIGLHYVRYHSRLPLLMARTGDEAAVAATAEPFVAARAAVLATDYLEAGFDPAAAVARGRETAEALTLSDYGNEASYFATYPEHIEAIGLSFSTSTIRTGSLISGEITRHFGYPFQIAPPVLFGAVFSPVLFDPDAGTTPLGEYGPSSVVQGFKRLDRTQINLQIAQIFRGRLRADQVVVSADVAWIRVHDMPGNGEPPLTSRDADSWGYRLQASAVYTGVFGGVNVIPFAGFSRDVNGTTPAPLSAFVEDRRAITVGIRAEYINRISADLSYVGFFDGGRANLVRDRDYLRLQVTWAL